jgi:hypothetical protein
MARKPLETVLEDLEKQEREIAEAKQRVAEQIKERNQRRQDERLRAYGLLVERWLDKGRLNQQELLEELDPVLRFNKQRSVVGLPLIGIGSKIQKKDEPAQPAQPDDQVEGDSTPPRAGEPAPPIDTGSGKNRKDGRRAPARQASGKSSGGSPPKEKRAANGTNGKNQPPLQEDDEDDIARHFSSRA